MFGIVIMVALAILNGIIAGRDLLYNTGGPWMMLNYISAVSCGIVAIGMIGRRMHNRKGDAHD